MKPLTVLVYTPIIFYFLQSSRACGNGEDYVTAQETHFLGNASNTFTVE